MNRKGYSLIELILVIAILGALASAILPKFITFSTDGENSSREFVVGAIRTGLAMHNANVLVNSPKGTPFFPDVLDTNGLGAGGIPCTHCFSTVLENGINDNNWRKTAATTYVFNDGEQEYTYEYDPQEGTFYSDEELAGLAANENPNPDPGNSCGNSICETGEEGWCADCGAVGGGCGSLGENCCNGTDCNSGSCMGGICQDVSNCGYPGLECCGGTSCYSGSCENGYCIPTYSPPLCGDGICESPEVGNCPQDCGGTP